MDNSRRPSVKELEGKLLVSSILISSGRFMFANDETATKELQTLKVDADRIADVLNIALSEIGHINYCGQHPPMRAYEAKIKNCELFAFVWQSTYFTKRMYLKFTIKNDIWYLVSLHKSK